MATRLSVRGWVSNGSGGSMPSFCAASNHVAGVAMAVADGDCLVHLVAAAVLLARCRADSAKDRGERDGALEDARRLAELALGVGLEEARDVDVARALVLTRRQAVGVVVAEDQLEVGPAQPADSSVWVRTTMPATASRAHEIVG